MTISLPEKYSQPLLISEGSYGVVFRAKQKTLNRYVAIKILKEDDRLKRKELINEAMIQADISISTIPHIHDAFEYNKKVYIVMEWIDGISLSHYINNNIIIDNNISLCRDLIASVAEIHKRGYAHRDIKPENIILSRRELPVFVDFGLAKHVFNGEESMEGLIKGTPNYMAPELWTLGPNVDLFRADIFSLAKVLSFLLQNSVTSDALNNALSVDPRLRPINAQEMMILWDNEFPLSQFGENKGWRKWAENSVVDFLFEKKIRAIEGFINNANYEDAYWLCVECVNERPDSEKALSYLDVIEKNKKKRNKRRKDLILLSSISGMVCLIAMAIVYFFYNDKNNNDIDIITAKINTNRMMETISKPLDHNYEFKSNENNKNYIWLNSELEILNIPSESKLYVNKKEAELNGRSDIQLTLGYGEYLLELFRDGNQLWRERIFLAPFQKVRISVKY